MAGDGAFSETATALKTVFWFGLFMFSSAGMVIFNKLIMQAYAYPAVLIFVQSAATVLFQLLGTRAGLFSMKRWQLEHFKKWSVAALLFVMVLGSSMKALPYIAVATTIVFRNLGTCAVALGDALLFGKVFTTQMKGALAVMVAGSLVYAMHDANYHPVGYFWISINTALWAATVLFEKWATVSTDQTGVGISCYQNLVCLPILVLEMASSGEVGPAAGAWAQLSGVMRGYVFLTAVMGCSLSICYMSLNKIASATAITIASNVNKLVSAVVGAYIFNASIERHAILGLVLCVVGALLWSFAPKPPKPASLVASVSKGSLVEMASSITALATGKLDPAPDTKRLLPAK